MLRRSAARAFAGPEVPAREVAPAPAETRRDVALAQLFRDLRSRLDEEAKRRRQTREREELELAERAMRGAVDGARAPRESSGTPPDDDSRLTLSAVEAKPSGVEFTLRGPECACRFRDTLGGFIHVTVSEPRRSEVEAVAAGSQRDELLEAEIETVLREEILSVHPYWGVYRPILKPILVGGGPALPRGRTAFCYSSAVELAEHYLDLAGGCD